LQVIEKLILLVGGGIRLKRREFFNTEIDNVNAVNQMTWNIYGIIGLRLKQESSVGISI